MRDLSPLRYPGGKARLAPYLARLASAQFPRVTSYAEPFAGGAGAALRLLVDELVPRIHINDLNPGITAMWRAIFSENERFKTRILAQVADLPSWQAAKRTYLSGHAATDDPFELGFATFLLNRWNRSGILTARPIGGLHQEGRFKIDARFNRSALADRIELLGEYRNRVSITQMDGQLFLEQLGADEPRAFVYVDPPYLNHGDSLYLNSLSIDDHRQLAQRLRASPMRWMLTYDSDSRIPYDFYKGLSCLEFRIAHTAQSQHIGAEYAIFSRGLRVVDVDVLPRAFAKWIAVADPRAMLANRTKDERIPQPSRLSSPSKNVIGADNSVTFSC